MARILIAEDEEPVRRFLERALRLDGHEVRTAEDGAAALDRLAEQEPDLLLSDIRMPLMDGIELALTAKRDFPALTIVLMTAFAEQRERAQELDVIVDDVLLKPFTLDHLRTVIHQALDGRPT